MSNPTMPYSPLDALINALPEVRKASKVVKGDNVLSVQQRIADVFLPIVKRIQEEERKRNADYIAEQAQGWLAEARAAAVRECCTDVCSLCRRLTAAGPAERINGEWKHPRPEPGAGSFKCHASAIHEHLYRESQTEKEKTKP